MKKERVIQFVCFITELTPEEFIPSWEAFAKKCVSEKDPVLLQLDAETKKRYKYISQHESKGDNFLFAFMKGRNSEHFPDQKVKVLQAGGYQVAQLEYDGQIENGDVKIIAFVDHNDRDLDFYRKLLNYRHLNIYQAYYESCTYAYILEFCIPEINAPDLLRQIKTNTTTEAACYRECLVNA